MRQELIDKLINHQKIMDDECFELSIEISRLLNTNDESKQSDGRELIIRVLDNWNNISDSYKNIFTDLVSSAGFYPYIHKLGLKLADFSDEIRMSYHQSNNLENRYFHSEQKKIDGLIKNHVNVIVSAPTSFGKSMLIEEIVASGEYKNIVIIQPTLALLDETRRKLKAYSDKYKIIVKTTQSYSEDKGNIFLLTAERVLEYPNMPPIQLLILDEFYKLSDKRGDNRSSILNIAFVRLMKNPDCRFYMLGPNIDSIPDGFVEKYNAVFYKTAFSMVLTESEDRYEEVKTQRGGKVSEKDVFDILDSINEQTLIYCASPAAARKLAFSYCAHLCAKGENAIEDLPLVEWISDNLSYRWSLSRCLQYEIAVHDGAMPKHITSSVIQYFNQKKIKYLFCTNTIIEGVNTSAKNVVFYDNKIGSRKIDYFDYSNIKGRAGRMMEHYVGRIINLHKPPKLESTEVDFPFFEQDPISSEILVNLEENEIKDINDNLARYVEFKSKDPELQDILVRNGVTIEGQERILERLFADLSVPLRREMIIWNRIDAKLYDRLSYIFELCWETLSTEEERKSFDPKGWVVNKIVGSCYQTTTNQMIEKDIEYRAKKLAEEKEIDFISVDDMFGKFPVEMQAKTDHIIEKIFALQKNWLQYRAPKWINVVDSLQKYATQKLGLPSGDYSYIAEMIENEFVQSSLRILLEYGIPQSAVQKLQIILKMHKVDVNKISEDMAIKIIVKHREDIRPYMSKYEMEIIDRAI